MSHTNLSRRETTVLRGLAIGLIIIHNFCHWLPRCIDENEYTWALSRIQRYVHYIQDGGPHLVLNFFSHYGHYGVALFLFLSGYGLVKKYEAATSNIQGLPIKAEVPERGVASFLLHHAVKLWQLMIPALIALWALKSFYAGNWNWHADAVIQLLTFTVNLNPHRPLILGPWWWFSLMMQFYILYRLVLYRRGKTVLLTTVALCLALQFWATFHSLGQLHNSSCIMTYLHYNFPCSVLPFALGIWTARYGADWLFHPLTAVISVAVVVAGSYNPWIWSVASPFAVAIMLQGRRLPLHWLGTISAWVFAIHPIVREYTIGPARAGHTYTALFAYLAVTLLTAWIVTLVSKKVKKFWKQYTNWHRNNLR